MGSNSSDCPTLCIPPLLRGCEKINGPNVLLGLGIYDPDFLVVHEDRGKRGQVCNSLVTFVNLMVVNGYGSPDRISSIDSLLISTMLLRNLKRVIPPRTGLLRLMCSSPSSGFLMNLSKEKISVKRSTLDIPGDG
jgi:hypothetical protein